MSWAEAALVQVWDGVHHMLSADVRWQATIKREVRLINEIISTELDGRLPKVDHFMWGGF